MEVLPSVAASVATTIIAFMPLMYVSGVMGKFIAVMPVAIIAMLLISLFESSFILPCHLAHGHHEEDREPFRFIAAARSFREKTFARICEWTLGLFLASRGRCSDVADRSVSVSVSRLAKSQRGRVAVFGRVYRTLLFADAALGIEETRSRSWRGRA